MVHKYHTRNKVGTMVEIKSSHAITSPMDILSVKHKHNLAEREVT